MPFVHEHTLRYPLQNQPVTTIKKIFTAYLFPL